MTFFTELKRRNVVRRTGLYLVGALTPALLRLDPGWDNLRDDPRFRKLCLEPTK
jgi:hypothetical protein